MTQVAGHRRFITLIALLCQVATATQVPMLHAATASNMDAALEHCAGHGQSQLAGGSDHITSLATDHVRQPGHAGSCGCGLCQCPCAQAAAIVPAVLVPAPAKPLPFISVYRLPDVPQLTAALFRPPI